MFAFICVLMKNSPIMLKLQKCRLSIHVSWFLLSAWNRNKQSYTSLCYLLGCWQMLSFITVYICWSNKHSLCLQEKSQFRSALFICPQLRCTSKVQYIYMTQSPRPNVNKAAYGKRLQWNDPEALNKHMAIYVHMLCLHYVIWQRLHCSPCIRGISMIRGNELLKTDEKEEYCTVQSLKRNIAISMLPYQQNITLVPFFLVWEVFQWRRGYYHIWCVKWSLFSLHSFLNYKLLVT